MKKYTFLLSQFLLLLTTHLAYAQIGIGPIGKGSSPKPLWQIILVIVLMFGFFIIGSVLLRRRFQFWSEYLLQRINSEGIILEQKEVRIKISYKTSPMLLGGVSWVKGDIYLTARALYVIPSRQGEFPLILAKRNIPGLSRLVKQYTIKGVEVSEETLIIEAVYLREKSIWRIKVSDPDLWKQRMLENLGSEDEAVA
ncbi:MAG: hypothetical protein LWW95_11785 [Candidatus Desulfofervidus auxilii]|nr:hypothetical protein [Candidatus Desulfofervidus auxilii]